MHGQTGLPTRRLLLIGLLGFVSVILVGGAFFRIVGRYQARAAGAINRPTATIKLTPTTKPATVTRSAANSAVAAQNASINWRRDIAKYNCAGFALRTYRRMSLDEVQEALKKFRPLRSRYERCEPGQIKIWFWQYDVHHEARGQWLTPASRDGHIISGLVTNPDGTGPDQVYCKFNDGPILGPGAPEIFAPPVREMAGTTPDGQRIHVVRQNMVLRCYAAWPWQLPK